MRHRFIIIIDVITVVRDPEMASLARVVIDIKSGCIVTRNVSTLALGNCAPSIMARSHVLSL